MASKTGKRVQHQQQEYELTDIYLYLTDQCNLCCSHCWISPGFSREQQDSIPLDALKATISEAKALGLQRVKLTGGEPLLYRNLTELLEFLTSEDISIFIETNGLRLDRIMIESFKSFNVDHISVSLDAASGELHDGIRGVKGSFQRTMQGLKLLSDSGIDFQIIMTLQRKNSEEIPALIRLSDMLGASSLKINPLQPCGRAMESFKQNNNLTLDELIRLHRMVQEGWPYQDNLEVYFDLPMAFLSVDEILRVQGQCWILNILGILANGDFSICGIGQTVDELRMGNLYHDSICDVWKNNPVLGELRQSLPYKLTGICQNCIFKFQCLGACRANAYALEGDLYASYFLCQEFSDAGLFPTSRCFQ